MGAKQEEAVDTFDVLKLNEHLRLCLTEDTTDSPGIDRNEASGIPDATVSSGTHSKKRVIMDEYIHVFHQLYKFFCLLGAVFGFVASDVKAKLEILQSFREGANSEKYASVNEMLLYEKESGYLQDNKSGNASRTFLRLHRALRFVSLFLNKTLALQDNDGTSGIARSAYNETLSKYHPWLIQKGAQVAMCTLPTKKDLFRQVIGKRSITDAEAEQMLIEAIKHTQEIYEACEKLYSEHDLLNLP